MEKEQAKHSKPIATQVVPATEFYSAEDHHQQYLEKVRSLNVYVSRCCLGCMVLLLTMPGYDVVMKASCFLTV